MSARRRRASLLAVTLAGCAAPGASAEATHAAAPGPAPPGTPRVDGRCEPTPKQGAPCHAGDSYCVLSWGEPGGHSAALWCREGRWRLEHEVNLPE